MTKDEIVAIIKGHIKENLDDVNIDEIDINRSMRDYGANSLDVIEVVSSTMRELKIKVPRSELEDIENISQLADTFLKYCEQPAA